MTTTTMPNREARFAAPELYAARKLGYCIRRARRASRDSWNEPACDRAEYKRLRREAMQDARRWRAELTGDART